MVEMRCSKDIINLVEDIRCLLTQFNDSNLEYYNNIINIDVDALTKKAHL